MRSKPSGLLQMQDSASSGRTTLVLALLAQAQAMIPVSMMGSLYPLISQEIAVRTDQLGFIVACFFAASALGSILLAPLADVLGPWKVARLSFAGLIAGGVCLMLSANFAMLAAGMAIAGIANGCVQPATNVAITRFVPAGRQGFAFSLKQCAVPVATMVGGLTVPMIGLTLGWRAGFALAALMATLIFFLLPAGGAISAQPKRNGTKSMPMSLLVMLGVMAGLGAGSANAMAAYLAAYSVHKGISPASAGLLLASGSIVSIMVRLALGWAADRYRMPLMAVVGLCFGGGAAAYVLLGFSDSVATLVAGALLGFGMGWGWAGISLLAIVRASVGRAGRATGITQAGLFTGAVIGPLSFGWLSQAVSFTAGWIALACATFIAALLAFVGQRWMEWLACNERVNIETRQAERA